MFAIQSDISNAIRQEGCSFLLNIRRMVNTSLGLAPVLNDCKQYKKLAGKHVNRSSTRDWNSCLPNLNLLMTVGSVVISPLEVSKPIHILIITIELCSSSGNIVECHIRQALSSHTDDFDPLIHNAAMHLC